MIRVLSFFMTVSFLIFIAAGVVYAAESPSTALLLYLKKGGGDPLIVKNFIEYGADVNYSDKKDRITPLHLAARYKHGEAVRVLLDHGADINAADNDKTTPLHEAVRYHSFEVVRILVDKGADLNLKDKEKKPPLYSIVYWDNRKSAIEVVNLFIERGFDVKKSADADFLNDAIARGRKDIALILLKKGIKFNANAVLDAVRQGYEDIFSVLIEKGADPNQEAILQYACKSGNINIVKAVTARGIKPSAEDIDFCLFNGHKETAVYLNRLLKEEKKQEVDIKSRCHLMPDGGNCKAFFLMAYFDSKACREFVYGGCGGVVPFDNLEACKRVCEESGAKEAEVTTKNSNETSAYKYYVMDKNYFSCLVPANWSLERDKEKDAEYGIYEIELISGAPMTTISIRYLLKDNADFNGYKDFLESNSSNVLGETQSAREKYGPVTKSRLNGRDAFELRRERLVYLNPTTKSDESAQIKEILYVIPWDDGSFYVLHYSARADYFDEYLSVFKRVVNSLKFRT